MSTAKTTLPISEVRKKLFEITDKVQAPGVVYTVTEKGYPKAVILSVEEYESLMETIDVLQEMPDLMKDIERVEKDIASGEYKNYITLEELRQKFPPYDVSPRPAARRAKKVSRTLRTRADKSTARA